MRSLQERHDLTYIVISHDLAVVKYLADTIGVMYLGKLVEIGPSEELYAARRPPLHPGPDRHHPGPRAVGWPSGIARRPSKASYLRPYPTERLPVPHPLPVTQDRCAEEEPLLRPFAEGHRAACHFPLQTPIERDLSSVSAVSA